MNGTNPHSKIVFAGDSITASGKCSEQSNVLGSGYVSLFSDLTRIRKPIPKYEIINSGIDGNTIGHLLSRWQDDVLSNQPDIAVILIGINDAIRLFEKLPSYHLPPGKFRETYRLLIAETLKQNPDTRILILEPFYITTRLNPVGSYRNDLADLVDQYIAEVRSVCDEFAVQRCGTNEFFSKILMHNPTSFLSADCIHLTRAGHLALAEAVYNSLFIPSSYV